MDGFNNDSCRHVRDTEPVCLREMLSECVCHCDGLLCSISAAVQRSQKQSMPCPITRTPHMYAQVAILKKQIHLEESKRIITLPESHHIRIRTMVEQVISSSNSKNIAIGATDLVAVAVTAVLTVMDE